MLIDKFTIDSPNVTVKDGEILSKYNYNTSSVSKNANGEYVVKPKSTEVQIKTKTTVPKLGVMLVGWGGNNGATVTAGILANKHKMTWMTKEGKREANYWGSVTQASTCRVGSSASDEIYVPFNKLVPMVNPNDIVLGGWDISSMNLADAMERSMVLDYTLQTQLRPLMKDLKPLPGIYDPDFIAANQDKRADNLIKGTKLEQMNTIRNHLKEFQSKSGVDKVIVLWTANTERYSGIEKGINDTADNFLRSIEKNEAEIAPSSIYAAACILEAPQNTFVPGLIELAVQKKVMIGGDDFKSGQTKMKSALVEFLVGAGIKPTSIVSYNHLGNNDGMNLSAPQTFRSKEISKSNVVDDMVASNSILYKEGKLSSKHLLNAALIFSLVGEHPDHVVVIKYVPYVGDSKRAMDEYTSEIFMGGRQTIVMHNTCEDSLLASPIILDLVILAEILGRIEFKLEGEADFHPFHPVASLLSYLTKAPLVPDNTPVVNALNRQRAALENVFRACVGLPPENNMLLECK